MWNRNWTSYAVKAVLAEQPEKGEVWPTLSREEIEAYERSMLPGWEAHLFQLATPMLVSGEIAEIVPVDRDGRRCRVYPPFALNQTKACGGYFEEVLIPEGVERVASRNPLPSSAVTGMISEPNKSEGVSYCHGIRFDREAGYPETDVLKELIDQVAQYTQQWWLRVPLSPFSGPQRIGAVMDRNYRIMDVLRYHGAGRVESTCYATVQTQTPLGFERPLTENVWRLCLHNVRNRIPAEIGLLSFADALAHYMAGEDKRCILDLCLCFEILESKRRLADKGRTDSKNKNLLKGSRLAQGKTAAVIAKLIIDRDHAAHGREPYIVGKDPEMMSAYLDAIRNVVNTYIEFLQPGEWPALAKLRLDSTRKR